MKNVTPFLAIAIATLCASATPAADKKDATIVRDYTDVVAPPDQAAYETGVKRFNQCLAQHGYKFAWTAWVHETGDTYTYSYTTDPLAWESFDAMHAQGAACDAALRAEVNPHLKRETSSFIQIMPELSHMPNNMGLGTGYIEVTNFKLKPGHEASEAFTTAAKKITAAAEKSKWPNYYSIGMIRDGGDDDAPDFVLVSPAKSWAELEKDTDPSVWQMVENVYGKEAGKAIRKSVNDALQSVTSHVDSYSESLTYKPSGK